MKYYHNSSPPFTLSAEKIARALPKWRKCGNDKYIACCPAHDDTNPSLSIRDSADGKILVHCFSGCLSKNVINSLQSMGLWHLTASNDYVNRRALREEHQHLLLVLDIAIGDFKTGNYQNWPEKDKKDIYNAVIRLEELRQLNKKWGFINE